MAAGLMQEFSLCMRGNQSGGWTGLCSLVARWSLTCVMLRLESCEALQSIHAALGHYMIEKSQEHITSRPESYGNTASTMQETELEKVGRAQRLTVISLTGIDYTASAAQITRVPGECIWKTWRKQ